MTDHHKFLGGFHLQSHDFDAASTSTTMSLGDDGSVKEQDRLLPIANIGRIMKQILPPNAKISKEAKETMQECVSEFIGFVNGEAADKCHKEKRKTINGDDVCWALGNLGFDNYNEALRRYLSRYRSLEEEKPNSGIHNKGGYKDTKGTESPTFRRKDQSRN